MKCLSFLLLSLIVCFSSCQKNTSHSHYDVIVIGAGTGAVSAAIQSARSGAKTILINPLPWLGGMLTSAGVSATDGNHQLHAGLWAEFRGHLRKHYGGTDSLFTGWVSNTMFEPKVGAAIWTKMAEDEKLLTIIHNAHWSTIQKEQLWSVKFSTNKTTKDITGKILIDGTDLGDVAAQVGATFDLGMDASNKTGESIAPEKNNNIIQDLTYAAILKDYGKNADKTIPKPPNYNAADFYCACKSENCDDETAHDCDKMLSYGKLPNGKYMLNWPKHGNDYYANVIDLNQQQRDSIYQLAKNHTLGFIYYIQTALGYKNIGLADDEFPSEDNLALMPYHREGRRIHGLAQLNIDQIVNSYKDNLYRTGVIVGDYPIDHHHDKNPNAPQINFPNVPSYSIPIGCLIPKNVDHLIIADKAISVTNIANGTTRLQPVIIQIGQVAGLMAAMAVKENLSPKDLNIRKVQNELLKAKGYLMPFIDVSPEHPHFESIQRVAATGILKGKGVPYKWANQTWFYPDTTISEKEFFLALNDFDDEFRFNELKDITNTALTIKNAVDCIFLFQQKYNIKYGKVFINEKWSSEFNLKDYNPERYITKSELAVLLDKLFNPFEMKDVNFEGDFITSE